MRSLFLSAAHSASLPKAIARTFVAGCARSIVLLLLTATSLVADASDDDKKYGKVLVASFDAPAKTIAMWNRFKASKPDSKEAPVVSALLAETSDWSTGPVSVKSDKNPYTVVIRLKGNALSDGPVAMMWQAGWVVEDGSSKRTLVPGLSRTNLKGGVPLTISGASAPSRFDRDRELGLLIGLVKADNWQFESAKVEVWSGIADASWWEALLSFQGAMIGVVLLGIMLWFRRR